MIRQVPITEILACKELIAEYAAECSIPAIGEINPQAEIYAALEKSGMMHCFLTDHGFAIILTPVLPHYGKKIANLESLFVSKGHRNGGEGRELMKAVEIFAKESGCTGILYSAPVGGSLERLLDASKSYRRTNSVFFRSFDESSSA